MSLIKPERFWVYKYGINFTYSIKYHTWHNKYDNKEWHGYDEKFIGICFNKHLFDIDDIWYDGHILKGITILGISFVIGDTYQAEHLISE